MKLYRADFTVFGSYTHVRNTSQFQNMESYVKLGELLVKIDSLCELDVLMFLRLSTLKFIKIHRDELVYMSRV